MRWTSVLASASAGLLLLTGCGSGSTESCISSDVGKVCADDGDGRITFSARGLEPGSAIELVGPDDMRFELPVGPDGTYDMESGAQGFLSVFEDIELTFTVSAVDSNGERLEGQLTATT